MRNHHPIHVSRWRRTALAVALSVSLGGVAMAQSTTGSVYGQATAGETVVITGQSGLTREVTVDNSGRFQVSNIPIGSYTVSLKKAGQVVDRRNVTLSPNAGTAVNFTTTGLQTTTLGTVTVSANALPAIDVTSVNSSTVITAADLAKLPVVRNAESIALLSPGTVSGTGFAALTGVGGQNLVAFGGSSVSENAYYVNGYNTGEPYKNLGGFTLPYGSIEQQETLTGGYSAKYGRSDGGVINQIGKRGTNEWHFGGQVSWQPRFLEGTPVNNRYGNPAIPAPVANPGSLDGLTHYALEDPSKPGTLNQYRNDNKQWETIYSAYFGGPLIEDKLFLFVAAETTKDKGTNVLAASNQKVQDFSDKNTKVYAKLDWNINDSNILELTALKNKISNGAGSTYDFDNDTLQRGAFSSKNDVTKDDAQFYIGHFTSYISDAATLSILYAQGKFQDPVVYGNTSELPFISRPYNQNPAFLPPGTGPNGIVNSQTNTTWVSPQATNKTHGLRVDFDYKLGDHDMAVGIDNMNYAASHQGPDQQNPFNPAVNYFWRYLPTSVQKRTVGWATSMSTTQKAYYLQDDWQVLSNLLLSIGIRNDHFTNYNDLHEAFVDEKNQWEPRIGASWDVMGDSSFKIYGNMGRYYLALPDNAAERAANVSTYITQSFSYTGIDPATGIPTGLTPNAPPTSPDGEYGLPKDPLEVTARNLKPEYVDEFILGFDKKLNESWNYGAKAMWRDLKTAIDDECSPSQIANKMTSMGLDPGLYGNSLYGASYCRLINPGLTNTMLIRADDGSGSVLVPMTQKDWGFIHGVRRKIGSLNLYLEHPFDGKWMARFDYTWTRGFGNTEGQVRSDFGQGDVSKTEDWDSWQLMDGQDGELTNVRKHQLRFRGAYQITPEWLVSGILLAQSGTPKECLGYYGPYGVGDPTGYNGGGSGNYHWCHGVRIPPGKAGHTPWTEQLNLGVQYAPAFAQHKLAFHLDIVNVLNQQRPTQTDAIGESAYNGGVGADGVTPVPDLVSINNSYGDGIFWQPPRTVRLSVTYDY